MGNLKEENAHIKTRDSWFRALLFSTYIGFVFLVLLQIESITDYSFTLYEILAIPVNIGIFIIPLELLVVIFYSIIYYREIRKKRLTRSKKQKFIDYGSAASLILIFICVYYIFQMVSTSGICEDFKKISDNNKYYIVLHEKKIRCTENEYNLMDTTKTYMIRYDWNRLFPEKGKLIKIRLAN